MGHFSFQDEFSSPDEFFMESIVRPMPGSALNKRDTVWYIYLLSVIKIPTIQLHIQGVNEGLIGVDKQPISN